MESPYFNPWAHSRGMDFYSPADDGFEQLTLRQDENVSALIAEAQSDQLPIPRDEDAQSLATEIEESWSSSDEEGSLASNWLSRSIRPRGFIRNFMKPFSMLNGKRTVRRHVSPHEQDLEEDLRGINKKLDLVTSQKDNLSDRLDDLSAIVSRAEWASVERFRAIEFKRGFEAALQDSIATENHFRVATASSSGANGGFDEFRRLAMALDDVKNDWARLKTRAREIRKELRSLRKEKPAEVLFDSEQLGDLDSGA